MRSRPVFVGLRAASLACAALALRAAFAQSDVAQLLEQGALEDARLDTAAALHTFLQAAKLAPDDANVLYRVAREYALSMADTESKDEQRARGEQALEYAKRAIAADPKNEQAQLSAAISYGRLAPLMDTHTRVAYSRLVKEHADAALALDPQDPYGYHVLGVWNYELANLNPLTRALARAIYGALPAASFEAAEHYLLKAVELAPTRIAHRVELGRVYAALGKKDFARSQLALALSLPEGEKDDARLKRRARQALKDLQ